MTPVDIVVTFPCGGYMDVRPIAARFLPQVRILAQKPACHAAIDFLESLARKVGNPSSGVEAGLLAWTWAGRLRDTEPERFIEVLRPFWEDWLHDPVEHGGYLSLDHIVVFYRQAEDAVVYATEIYLDVSDDVITENTSLRYPLIVKDLGAMPFTWWFFQP